MYIEFNRQHKQRPDPRLLPIQNNAKAIFEEGGLEALFTNEAIKGHEHELTVLEITGYENVHFPVSIGKFKNLQNLVIEGVANIPPSLIRCQSLEIIAFFNSTCNDDISFLSHLPRLQVINLSDSPNFAGLEKFDLNKTLIVAQ